MKSTMFFDESLSFRNIIRLLSDIGTKSEWFSTIGESKLIKRYSRNVATYYYVIKMPFVLMQDREFVEKQVIFRHGDSVYIYASSIKDTFWPKRSNLTRGFSTIVGTKITKVDGKIISHAVSQMDLKLSMPTSLVGGKMADSVVVFRKELLARLAKM